MFGFRKKKEDFVTENIWSSEGAVLKWDPFNYVPTVSTTREQAEAVQVMLNAQPQGAWEDFVRKVS